MLCTFFLPPSWMDDGSEIIRFASPLPLPPHLAFMSGLNHFGWDPSKSLTYQLLRCHSGSAGLSSRIVKRTFFEVVKFEARLCRSRGRHHSSHQSFQSPSFLRSPQSLPLRPPSLLLFGVYMYDVHKLFISSHHCPE